MPDAKTNPPTDDYRGNPDIAAIRHRLGNAAAVCAAMLFALAGLTLLFESPVATGQLEKTVTNSDQAIGNPAVGIDPNVANWAELALLPGLGESVSKRIIEFREERKLRNIWPAFRRPEDLMRVKGIGEKTLKRMRPMLRLTEPASPD